MAEDVSSMIEDRLRRLDAEPVAVPPVARFQRNRRLRMALPAGMAVCLVVFGLWAISPGGEGAENVTPAEDGTPATTDACATDSSFPGGEIDSVSWRLELVERRGQRDARLLINEQVALSLTDADWGAPWKTAPAAYHWHVYHDGNGHEWLLGPTPPATATLRLVTIDGGEREIALTCAVTSELTPAVRWFATAIPPIGNAKIFATAADGSRLAAVDYELVTPVTTPPTGVGWSQPLLVTLSSSGRAQTTTSILR